MIVSRTLQSASDFYLSKNIFLRLTQGDGSTVDSIDLNLKFLNSLLQLFRHFCQALAIGADFFH